MIRQDLVIHCPDCQHDWPEGTLFCDYCGAVLSPWLTPPEELEILQEEEAPNANWADISGAMYGPPTDSPIEQTDGPVTSTISEDGAAIGADVSDQDDESNWGDFEPGGARTRGGTFADKSPELIWLRLTDGQIFELQGKTQYLIGRRDPRHKVTPDVDLTDWNGAKQGVSRVHASIYMTPIGAYVEDLESRNETLLNGYRLLPRQRYRLEDDDDLRLGTMMLKVHFVQP